jgi:predicted RND superfamily exporter protein
MSDEGRGRGPIRVRIERDFERWARLVARHRWWVIAAMLVATAVLGTGLSNVALDTSPESLFKKNDPTRVAYDGFRAQFGREDLILVAVETPDLWSFEFLERLRALHSALENEVPHLEEITSLVNARVTRGERAELVVGELLEDWPKSREELERIREIALATPLYADTLVSRDGRVTSVALRLNAYSDLTAGDDAIAGFEEPDGGEVEPPYLTGEEEAEAYLAVRRVMDRLEGPGFRLYCTGGPVVTARIMFDMTRNVRVFMLVVIATIALMLSVLFRRASGVSLSLCVVLLSVVATFGLQGLRGIPILVTTQILPSFLMAVGVGAAVHILVIFYQSYDRGASAEEAVAHALGHSGWRW